VIKIQKDFCTLFHVVNSILSKHHHLWVDLLYIGMFLNIIIVNRKPFQFKTLGGYSCAHSYIDLLNLGNKDSGRSLYPCSTFNSEVIYIYIYVYIYTCI
jgi:hypothetical protein